LIKETGPAVACMTLFENGDVELYVSESLLNELHDVLTRPKLQQRYSRLTEARADTLIASLRERAKLLKSVPRVFRYSRDPKDEPYLNLAIATGTTPECKEFRQRFRRVQVIDPVTFLKDMEIEQE
jgi:putative PIN family toxin of toxin-antitoxin system